MADGKKFAVFDIDGTLIRWQLYHALTDELARRGHVKSETYQTMRDARRLWKQRAGGTFKDYEKQVIGIYEAVLETLNFDQLNEAIDAAFEEYKDQTYTYTRNLLNRLKKKGYVLLAISGSQTEIVARLADYYGFDDYVGTVYPRRGSGFASTPKSIGALHKDQTLRGLIKKHALSLRGSIAIGDSTSDIAVLEMVEQPLAFNPEKELFDQAKKRGWRIVLERKNMVYELEKKDGRYLLVKAG